MPDRGNNKTKKSGCYACKYSKPETLHGRQETRCLLDDMLVMRPSKGCTKLKKKVMTNADRIRRMTDEELAEFFDKISDCQTCIDNPSKCRVECIDSRLKWLKQEVSEDAAD